MKINVLLDEDYVVDLLVKRVEFWTQDEDIIDLYRKMYENIVDCFNGAELDVMKIVDRDYTINCLIIKEGNEEYEDLKKLIMSGERDCSESTMFSSIEAFNDDYSLILVKY